MNIHIHIFKEELEKHTHSLMQNLRDLCYEAQELEDAWLFGAAPDHLKQISSLLNKNLISHGIHSTTELSLED